MQIESSVLRVIALWLAASHVAYASPSFESCRAAFGKPGFRNLASQLSHGNGNLIVGDVAVMPDQCLRLNDNEFVVIPEPTGGGAGSLFYCAFRGAPACRAYEGNFANVEVVKEVTNTSGFQKRFALLRSGHLSHGETGESYGVFYLVIPSEETQGMPFVVQNLLSGSNLRDAETGKSDLCNSGYQDPENTKPETAVAFSVPDVGVNSAGNARISFQVDEQNCGTQNTQSYHRDFEWQGHQFVEVSPPRPLQPPTLVNPEGLAVDTEGNLFTIVANSIIKIDAHGALTRMAGGFPGTSDGPGDQARFSGPLRLAIDKTGAIDVTEGGRPSIRRVTPGGVVTTIVSGSGPGTADAPAGTGSGMQPSGLVIDDSGNIFVTSDDHSIREVSPNGKVSLIAGGAEGFEDGKGAQARFANIGDIALAKDGTLYVADNAAVRAVSPDGTVSTLAKGSNEHCYCDAAQPFTSPEGIGVDSGGNVYASSDHQIFKIDHAGKVSLFAGGEKGYLDGPGADARFGNLGAIAVDRQDNVYVIDEQNEAIRKVTPAGIVSTVVSRMKRTSAGSAQ